MPPPSVEAGLGPAEPCTGCSTLLPSAGGGVGRGLLRATLYRAEPHRDPGPLPDASGTSDLDPRVPWLAAAGHGQTCHLVSANSDMIRWSRVLLSHTLDAARSY